MNAVVPDTFATWRSARQAEVEQALSRFVRADAPVLGPLTEPMLTAQNAAATTASDVYLIAVALGKAPTGHTEGIRLAVAGAVIVAGGGGVAAFMLTRDDKPKDKTPTVVTTPAGTPDAGTTVVTTPPPAARPDAGSATTVAVTGKVTPAATMRPDPSSNTAAARIQVRGGVFADEGIIAGKVYIECDCDSDRVQGPEERGIPGVRVYLEDGSFAITDVEGKYHFNHVRPRLHVVRLDATTLPVIASGGVGSLDDLRALAERRRLGPIDPDSRPPCEHCGRRFSRTRRHARWCSRACKQAAYRARRKVLA